MASGQNSNQPWWKKHQGPITILSIIAAIATLISFTMAKNKTVGDKNIAGSKISNSNVDNSTNKNVGNNSNFGTINNVDNSQNNVGNTNIVGNENIVGNKNTKITQIENTYESSPDYWIDIKDSFKLKPGSSMDVEVAATPMSLLNDTSCEWTFKTEEEELTEIIRFKQNSNNSCAGVISLPEESAAFIPISTATALNAKVAVHKDGEVYRATRLIPISHDASSPASLRELRGVTREIALEEGMEKGIADLRAKLTEDGDLSPEDEKLLQDFKKRFRKAFK